MNLEIVLYMKMKELVQKIYNVGRNNENKLMCV